MASQRRRHHATTMACFLVLCIAPVHCGRALPSDARVAKAQASNATAASADEFLLPHNQARAAVGVAPLVWSADLAAATAKITSQQQQGRNGCAFADMGASPYGANQGWAIYRPHPAEVVASWVAQGRYYSHSDNTCAAAEQCGTYTQVVWRRSAMVGCAQASCPTGATLTLCLYDPHGNVQGESPY